MRGKGAPYPMGLKTSPFKRGPLSLSPLSLSLSLSLLISLSLAFSLFLFCFSLSLSLFPSLSPSLSLSISLCTSSAELFQPLHFPPLHVVWAGLEHSSAFSKDGYLSLPSQGQIWLIGHMTRSECSKVAKWHPLPSSEPRPFTCAGTIKASTF